MHHAPRVLATAIFLACGPSACGDREPAGGTAREPAGMRPAKPGQRTTAPPIHWQCGETGVASRSSGPGTVHLFVSGRLLVLRSASSPAGNAVMADAFGNRFESSGGNARLTLSGEHPDDCTPVSRASPWFEAAERGVVLRAVGNEPGWLAEIRPGQPPAFHATLDYGDRVLDLPLGTLPRRATGAWTTATAGGEAVRLTATPAACRDGMSGVLYEARVDLVVGDAAYAGCGAFLDDFAAFME